MDKGGCADRVTSSSCRGVFKAGLAASVWLGQQGLLSAILRVIWLWGATGLLLSLAGILSKMTISTAVDAFGGMVKAAQQIISIGALAASGVGAAGAGAVGAAAPPPVQSRASLGIHRADLQGLKPRWVI